jgi:hypothetical protein
MKKILITILFLGISVHRLSSQSTSDVSKQLWFDLNPTLFKTLDLEYRGSFGVRKELGSGGWWRLIAVPQVRYNLGKKVFVIGGLGGYYTFNQVIDDRLEIRPFQGIMAKWPAIGNAALENYLRLEERVEFDTDNWNSKISLRLRLRLMFIYKFNAMEESRYWRILAGLEGFATLTGEQGQFQEQGRASIAADRSLRDDIVLRFEITWQKQNGFIIQNESVNTIYFRLRLYYTWGELNIVY